MNAASDNAPQAKVPRSGPAAVPIWPWPLGLGVLAAVGLGSALVVDGWGDAGAWLGLAAPLWVITWHLRRG